MSSTGNNVETKPAKLGLTITACDVCVCQKSRQSNQYSKAEQEWGHFRAQPNDQKSLEKTKHKKTQEKLNPMFSALLWGVFASKAVAEVYKPPLFIFTMQACSSNTFLSIITKASRQLEITAPPSSKSSRHNLD